MNNKVEKKQSQVIQMRCTHKEKTLLFELAKEKGMTLSDYIKDKVFGRKVSIRVTEKGIKEV